MAKRGASSGRISVKTTVRRNSPQTTAAQTSSRAGSGNVTRVTRGGTERHTVDQGSGKRAPGRSRGMGLRTKFMLVLAGVTVVVLVGLGASMATTTNRFLFSQKQQDGIEIARVAAQLGLAVNDRLNADLQRLKRNGASDGETATELITQAEKNLESYLMNAKTWGDNLDVSDIIAVRFAKAGDFLGGRGIGEKEDSNAPVTKRFPRLYIAKTGNDLALPDNIKVYEATIDVKGVFKPIYRFNIRLDHPGLQQDAEVRVDIAAQSVKQVSSNLYLIITVAVLVSIGVVIAIANWLAGNITKPVYLLLKDMQVVARGNLVHQTKPHSNDEIGVLAVEFNKMTQNLAAAQSALVENEKAEYELSLAREVQRQLLPADAPQLRGYDTAAFYQGAKAVSGDYFDIIPLGPGLWGFIVADVSGKGIPGSMVMAVTRTIVRLVANKHGPRAAETLKETNRLIAKQIKRGMFVTAFYAILEEATGIITYASAGHNPMIVYRAASKTCELASTKGIAIGFNEGPIFDKTIHDARISLNQGDAILLYTDGFPEAMNEKNEEFGDDRFVRTAAHFGAQESRALISGLVGEIAKHRGSAEQSDDLTIITLRKTA
ncbi:MAG: SpoIIE family protein phosphatase [Planctomycetes bacterium]|nr:SpoIIE family protein phosphatase [Planctomycetota bacterium]